MARSSTRRLGIVVNPERVAVVDELLAHCSNMGVEAVTVEPDTPEAITDAVRDLCDRSVDAVAAVGGDGTQRLAAGALAGSDTPLAVVPGGTVNLLARVHDLDDIESAVDAVVGGRTAQIDLGEVDGQIFVLNTSTGWDAAVIDAVDDRAKRFGRLGYSAVGALEWWRSDTGHVSIRLDGEPWYEGDAMTVVVLNVGQRGSASFSIAPDARLDDGLLDVVVLRRKSVVGLARATIANLRGAQPPPEIVAAAQAAEIDVTWDGAVPVQRDGDECAPSTRSVCRCRPGALRIVVPA